MTDTEHIGKLYINGAKVAEQRSMTMLQMKEATVYIGSSPTVDNMHYTGLMDEIRLFK